MRIYRDLVIGACNAFVSARGTFTVLADRHLADFYFLSFFFFISPNPHVQRAWRASPAFERFNDNADVYMGCHARPPFRRYLRFSWIEFAAERLLAMADRRFADFPTFEPTLN